jgi:hypothetical protein
MSIIGKILLQLRRVHMWKNATLGLGLLMVLGGGSLQGSESRDPFAIILSHRGADPRVVKPELAEHELGELLHEVNPAVAQKIMRAMELIESSADSFLFRDKIHLNTDIMHGMSHGMGGKRYGELVFEREAQATQLLNSLLKGERLEHEVEHEIEHVIDEMLDLDFFLASTPIIEAVGIGDPKEIELSIQAFDEGRKAREEERFSEAITQFQKAWVHAVRSTKGQRGSHALVDKSETTSSFALFQNVPNPFSATTRISYSIPLDREVSLNVYDLTGRLVRVLVDGPSSLSPFTAAWDGKDFEGKDVPNGIYLYRLKSGEFKATKRLVLLR